jgi:hypothetical protein
MPRIPSNWQQTVKDMLEVWTLEEVLDAAITYRRNSERKDRLHELVGKLFYSWPPEVQAMIDAERQRATSMANPSS